MATQSDQPAPASAYTPFAPGPFSVGVRTIEARDSARGRQFPCEIWYPAARQETGEAELRDAAALPGTHPLVVFSHASGHHRRGATFLCTHLLKQSRICGRSHEPFRGCSLHSHASWSILELSRETH